MDCMKWISSEEKREFEDYLYDRVISYARKAKDKKSAIKIIKRRLGLSEQRAAEMLSSKLEKKEAK